MFEAILQAIVVRVLRKRVAENSVEFEVIIEAVAIGVGGAGVHAVLQFRAITDTVAIGVGHVRVTGDLAFYDVAVGHLNDHGITALFFVVVEAIAVGINQRTGVRPGAGKGGTVGDNHIEGAISDTERLAVNIPDVAHRHPVGQRILGTGGQHNGTAISAGEFSRDNRQATGFRINVFLANRIVGRVDGAYSHWLVEVNHHTSIARRARAGHCRSRGRCRIAGKA